VTFGEWLRGQRDARGWTQVDLATLSGTNQATVSRLERGNRKGHRASLEILWRLASAFGLSMTDLFKAAGVKTVEGLEGRVAQAAYTLQNLPADRRSRLLALIEAEAAQGSSEGTGSNDGGSSA